MKLLYITSTFPYGPGEAFIESEILALQARGHEVFILPMHARGPVVHGSAAALLHRTLEKPLVNRTILAAALRGWTAWPRALRLVFTRSPKHLLKNVGVIPKALWLAGWLRRHGVDHVHVHWAATTASLGLVACALAGVPWSITAHRWDIVENNLLAQKARRASFTRFISRSGLELAQTRGFPARARHGVIHMGVTLPERAERVGAENAGVFRLLCPANLVPVKGHAHLLEAMALLADESVTLHIAGHGELEGPLRARMQELNLSRRVSFLGQLPHEDLLGLYRRGEVDAVVLPSVDLGGGLHEGIPVSLIEAMAHGVPVISTLTGGIPELLGNGAGVLVPPASPEALADAVASLIRSTELRAQYGTAGQRRVYESFDVRQMVVNLERVFRADFGKGV
ncbi:glycosyltransferase family 4 protein [Deinococcus antarcticus]|uniref:Glycosyltransferase family 4 protein n=1 Tax=Deinococcus antarcticus TaxID=1298767 RepID=A0ABV8A313_9DEIO